METAWLASSARFKSPLGVWGEVLRTGARGASICGRTSFFGSGGAATTAVVILAITFGAGTSRWISSFGTGCQMNCLEDFAFGDIAMMASRDSSLPRGFGNVPTLLAA